MILPMIHPNAEDPTARDRRLRGHAPDSSDAAVFGNPGQVGTRLCPGRRLLSDLAPSRSALGLVVCGCLALFTTRCAKVDPSTDYQHAAQIVLERTGSPDVYSPEIDDAVDRRVAELLNDGLTLDEAVRVALLNNHELQAAFAEIGVSRADVVQSTLWSNPIMSLGVLFPEGGGRSKVTVGFAQQIADLWMIPVRKRVTESQLEQTILAVGHRAVELSAAVRQAYLSAVALSETELHADESIRQFEKTVDIARRQHEAGEVSAFDADLVGSSLLEARRQRITIAGRRRQALDDLARLLGLARRVDEFSLLDSLPLDAWEPPDDATLLVVAASSRLDARAAELRTAMAEDELVREHLKRFPNVVVGLSYERKERRSLPERNVLADTARSSVAAGQLTAPSIQSQGQRNLQRSQFIDSLLGPSISLTLPLWDQNQAQIATAGLRVLQARRQYDEVLERSAHEIRRSADMVRTNAALVRHYRDESLPQAQRIVEGATRLYETGHEGVLVVIEAQEALISRQLAYVEVLRDCAVSREALRAAVGGVLPAPSPPEAPRAIPDPLD